MKELEELTSILDKVNYRTLIQKSAEKASNNKSDEYHLDQLQVLHNRYGTMGEKLKSLLGDYKKLLTDPKTSPETVEELTDVIVYALQTVEGNQKSLAAINNAYQNLRGAMKDLPAEVKQQLATPERVNPTTRPVIGAQRARAEPARGIDKPAPTKPLPLTPPQQKKLSDEKNRTMVLLEGLEKNTLLGMLTNSKLNLEPQTRNSLTELYTLCQSALPSLVSSMTNVEDLRGLNAGLSQVRTDLLTGDLTAAKTHMAQTLHDNIPAVRAGIAQQQTQTPPQASPSKPLPRKPSKTMATPPSEDAEKLQQITAALERFTQSDSKMKDFIPATIESRGTIPASLKGKFRDEIDQRVTTMKERAGDNNDLKAAIDKYDKMAKECLENPNDPKAIKNIKAILNTAEERVEKATSPAPPKK